MKTNYRFFYVITLLLALVFLGCSEDNDPGKGGGETEEPGGDNGPGSEPQEPMYFPPVGSEDWDKSTAQEIGWDTASFNDAIRYARDNRSNNLMIIHRGKIVAEEYWRGTTPDSLHDLNSVAKSFMAIVIGVLQQEGKLDINDKVSKYIPAGWSQSPETEDKITIKQLMTMTSGLNDDLQRIGAPEKTWKYSHQAYKVLYDVIAKAGNDSYRDLFNDILFSKIGMTSFTWSGKDIATSARPLARFGLMVLNRGEWNGQRIIKDDKYFSNMLKTSQSIQPAYGYLWWLNGTKQWYDGDKKILINGAIAGTMPADGFMAKGMNDQRVYVVPSLDLVVVRQGRYTGLIEAGEGSFDVEFWKRMMNAINNGALNNN